MDKRKLEILELSKEALMLKKNQKQDAFQIKIVEAEIRKISSTIEDVLARLKELKEIEEANNNKKSKKKIIKTQEEIDEEKKELSAKIDEQEHLLTDAKTKLIEATTNKNNNLERYENLVSKVKDLVKERENYINELIEQDESPVLDLSKVAKTKRIINTSNKHYRG